MSKTKYKYGDSVHVSDDGKNWVPAFLVGYNSDVFYRYIVKRTDCEDEIGYRFCVPSKVYYRSKKEELTDRLFNDFLQFLQTIPSGIRGNNPNKEVISKYMKFQKNLVIGEFQNRYHL